MTKQKLLLFLLLIMGMVQGAMAQEKEAYAVLSEENTVLTFYYDTQKADRNGMSVGPFESTREGSTTSWYQLRGFITTVVFDASFADCTSLASTAYWFYECYNLVTITGIENLKTDNVTDMQSMFYHCTKLTSLDLSGFKTDNVTNMQSMFYECSRLTSLDLSSFKTDNVTSMRWMFHSCSGLSSLDLSGFKTDNQTDMSCMFQGCSGLKSLDLSGFRTDNVTSMSYMFNGCSGLTNLDLSGFRTANVKSMSHMFAFCRELTSLDLSSFKTDNVTYMESMFYQCTKLTSLDLSGFKTDNVKDMSEMFSNCSGLTNLDLSGFKTNNVTNMSRMFEKCGGLTNLDLSGFETNNVTSLEKMFSDCSHLTSLDLNGFKNDKATNMSEMFSHCSGLTNLDLSGFKTDNVTNMSGMFESCSGLTCLDLSGFKTDNVANMSGMFGSCSGLTCLDLSGFKTDNVANMSGMFSNCSGLRNLDLSGFKTHNVTTMTRMFYNCRSLTTIYAGYDWSVKKAGYSFDIFRNCTNLVGGNGTTYDSKHTDCEYACIDKPGQPGYFSIGGATIILKEPYAHLSEGNTVLTFYYDTKKEDRDGMSVGPFTWFMGTNTSWNQQRETITTVVFDASFADCTSLTSTACWFYECRNLVTITGIENLKTDNVTDMSYMFSYCSGLTSLDLSGFKTDSVTNMRGMFSHCSGLTILDLSGFKTDNVTDMSELFSNCSGLTSLDLSVFKTDNVTDMSAMFTYCSGLTSLDLSGFKTDNVTRMVAMFGSCSGLTILDLSGFKTDNVTNMSGMFSFCSGLTSLDLSGFKTDNVTNMSFMFNSCSGLTSLDLSGFKTGSLTNLTQMFSSCSSLKTIYAGYDWSMDKVISDRFMFWNCTNLVGGNGTMYNSSHTGREYARIDEVGQPGYFTNRYDVGTAITLNVTDDESNAITQNVSIVWYDADGKLIGTGSKLSGVAEDVGVYYSVLLPEALGRVYREVNMRKADADENGTLTCRLEKIGRVALEGRVSATDIDKAMLTVSVRQMLNGKWAQNYTTQTNAQGLFSVEVYDDVTDITISGDGYLDTMLHRDGFGGSGNVGTIPVNLLTGYAIAANISMEKAVMTGEAPRVTAWTDGLTNIDFKLTNLTKGTALTDVAVQGSNVVIRSGAAVGDVISLKAVSKQGVFADGETSFTIADGANHFDLFLKELGGVDATFTASSNGTTVGYLYDHNNVLAARASYKGETLSLRHLKSGTYTLVSMGQSLLLGSMTSLADLNAVGLSEGTDYVATRIDVADGELTAASISDVPRLDETPFYYTTGNTYFNANKASVTAGDYITLQAHVDLKPEHADKANGVTLTIDLPEGCQMVENSVIANRQAVPHTVSGNRLTMTLAKEQYESEVRFCVTPTLNQSYTVTAMATFDIDGQVQQPIGTALFEAKGLSLRTPKYTSSTAITINGTAKKHSEVNIYDNDVLVGTTTSKANGSWTAQCELYKPYSHSFHDIYAKITTEDGLELTSETKQVEYNKTGIVPSSVMMTYYNGWYKKNIDVTFDLLNGTTSPSSYPFYTATDFTFLADFTRNDSTVVKNVSIKVLNSDGTVRTLPATFDGKQGKWVATTMYSSTSRLPKNVTVEYDLIPRIMSDDEHEEAIQDLANTLITCGNVMGDYLLENMDMSQSVDGDRKWNFECTLDGFDKPLVYQVKEIDYALAAEMMQEHQFDYTKDEEGVIGYYTDWADDLIIVTGVDIQQKNALQLILSVSEDNANNSRRRAAGDFPLKTSAFGDKLLDIVGVLDYVSVKEDMNNMRNRIKEYGNSYDKIRSALTQLMLEKCPNGELRLSKQQIEFANIDKNDISVEETRFSNQYYEYIEEYKHRLEASLLTELVTFGVGKRIEAVFKSTKFLKSPANKWIRRLISRRMHPESSAELLSNSMGIALNAIQQGVKEVFSFNDFQGKRDFILSWSSQEHNKIVSKYLDLRKNIESLQRKCTKDEEDDEEDDEEKNDEPRDEKSDNKPNFIGDGTTPILDPSGYVYEAVLSNRLEGVTATCYEQQGGSAVLWNAGDYSQQNPLKTDAAGFYRWDVPQGMWQVKYEKEGYETTYSDWLPVPPPQLDVNVGMKQALPPSVKKMHGVNSGITIEMSKYMLPATMSTNNIIVTCNGSATKGSIKAVNLEKSPTDEAEFVSKVKFVPEVEFKTGDEVMVTVRKEVESYCGTKMTNDHVEKVLIEAEVKEIYADSLISVPYQGSSILRVATLPKNAAAGKVLKVRSSSSLIAALDKESAVLDEDGVATFTVNGELPGSAYLTFEMEGMGLSVQSKVKVVIGNDLVATPEASLQSGKAVVAGAKVELKCATEGATIYYTLDGSCPCDEAKRIKYEAPITLNKSCVLKAMAVCDNLTDSDVATFVYTILPKGDANGDEVVNASDIVETVSYILGKPSEKFVLDAADVNGDSTIDNLDVEGITKIIMGYDNK